MEAETSRGSSAIRDRFRKMAHACALAVGSTSAFFAACVMLVAWALFGPMYHYSDTWQLVINTTTSVVTFLMVFLIQNTQNRDSKAIQLKLDELIRALHGARNKLVDLESFSDEELKRLEAEFERLRERSKQKDVDDKASG